MADMRQTFGRADGEAALIRGHGDRRRLRHAFAARGGAGVAAFPDR
jgi:hypothetical protein